MGIRVGARALRAWRERQRPSSIPNTMLTLVTLALATTVASQDLTPPLVVPALPRLLVDHAVDGTVWARGVDFKLALDRRGARFMPRERRAREIHALTLGPAELTLGGVRVPLDRLAEPTLDGTTAAYDRGGVTELWELSPYSVRQSFLLTEPLGEGDLVLRIPLGGALLPVGVDALDGSLLFESPSGGQVTYGHLLAFDRDGRKWSAPSRLDGDSIVLHVPAAFLAHAVYPVVVDPLIATLNYDGGTDDPTDPDCAIDQSSGRLLVVFHDTFASNDSDIIARRFTADGVFLEEVAVDISNEETVDVSVACNEAANQFLMAWTQTGAGLFNTRKIEARTRQATTTGQGPELNLSFNQGNESTPDVGGTTFGASNSPYFVVWSERGTGTGQNIRGRSVTPSGVLGNALWIDVSFGDELLPTITKDNGAPLRWGVAYQDQVSSTQSEVKFAFIENGGTVVDDLPAFFFEGQGNNSRPDVAGDGELFIVVFQQRQATGDSDIGEMVVSAPVGSVLVSFGNLTDEEPGATIARHQVAPAIALVGNGFVYAYQEAPSTSTSAFDVYLASIALTGGLEVVEGHVLASPGSPGFDGGVNLCAFSNGTRAFPVWTKVDSAGDRDVQGALYDHP
jgi:hypothetical protein